MPGDYTHNNGSLASIVPGTKHLIPGSPGASRCEAPRSPHSAHSRRAPLCRANREPETDAPETRGADTEKIHLGCVACCASCEVAYTQPAVKASQRQAHTRTHTLHTWRQTDRQTHTHTHTHTARDRARQLENCLSAGDCGNANTDRRSTRVHSDLMRWTREWVRHGETGTCETQHHRPARGAALQRKACFAPPAPSVSLWMSPKHVLRGAMRDASSSPVFPLPTQTARLGFPFWLQIQHSVGPNELLDPDHICDSPCFCAPWTCCPGERSFSRIFALVFITSERASEQMSERAGEGAVGPDGVPVDPDGRRLCG